MCEILENSPTSGIYLECRDQGSRIGWSLENVLDFLKKSFQRLPMAIFERAGRRVSGDVLQENAQEEGKAEKQHSHWWPTVASGKRVEKSGPYFLKQVIALKSRIPQASRFWDRTRSLRNMTQISATKSKQKLNGMLK